MNSTKNGTTKQINRIGNGSAAVRVLRPFDLDEIKANCRLVKGRTKGQDEYIRTIEESIITICAGVPGTGKTYIATAKAIEMYRKKLVDKILFSRPNVTCGKGLGHLPGELEDKFYPFVRPFQAAINDFTSEGEADELVAKEIFEFIPPDYMNGCTFNRTVLLLDEAQNAEEGQLNMFLTRIGKDSRIIMTGNPQLSDLRDDKKRDYFNLVNQMSNPPYIDGLNVVRLGVEDIVRNNIIQQIVEKRGIDG